MHTCAKPGFTIQKLGAMGYELHVYVSIFYTLLRVCTFVQVRICKLITDHHILIVSFLFRSFLSQVVFFFMPVAIFDPTMCILYLAYVNCYRYLDFFSSEICVMPGKLNRS